MKSCFGVIIILVELTGGKSKAHSAVCRSFGVIGSRLGKGKGETGSRGLAIINIIQHYHSTVPAKEEPPVDCNNKIKYQTK